MNLNKAIDKISQAGILLVFPIKNQKDPKSLWSSFYPKSRMLWEWDDDGDSRVADLWHLRTELSECRDVVYAKWFQGRATMFSKTVFTLTLSALGTVNGSQKSLGRNAYTILNELNDNSPQSSRFLREVTELQGKFYEAAFNRSMKELWQRLLIVGFGEFDDGAFPSLAIGSTKLLFEELWDKAQKTTPEKSMEKLQDLLGEDSPFFKYLLRVRKQLTLTNS